MVPKVAHRRTLKRRQKHKRNAIDSIKHHRRPQDLLRPADKDADVEEQQRHLQHGHLRKVHVLEHPEEEQEPRNRGERERPDVLALAVRRRADAVHDGRRETDAKGHEDEEVVETKVRVRDPYLGEDTEGDDDGRDGSQDDCHVDELLRLVADGKLAGCISFILGSFFP